MRNGAPRPADMRHQPSARPPAWAYRPAGRACVLRHAACRAPHAACCAYCSSHGLPALHPGRHAGQRAGSRHALAAAVAAAAAVVPAAAAAAIPTAATAAAQPQPDIHLRRLAGAARRLRLLAEEQQVGARAEAGLQLAPVQAPARTRRRGRRRLGPGRWMEGTLQDAAGLAALPQRGLASSEPGPLCKRYTHVHRPATRPSAVCRRSQALASAQHAAQRGYRSAPVLAIGVGLAGGVQLAQERALADEVGGKKLLQRDPGCAWSATGGWYREEESRRSAGDVSSLGSGRGGPLPPTCRCRSPRLRRTGGPAPAARRAGSSAPAASSSSSWIRSSCGQGTRQAGGAVGTQAAGAPSGDQPLHGRAGVFLRAFKSSTPPPPPPSLRPHPRTRPPTRLRPRLQPQRAAEEEVGLAVQEAVGLRGPAGGRARGRTERFEPRRGEARSALTAGSQQLLSAARLANPSPASRAAPCSAPAAASPGAWR